MNLDVETWKSLTEVGRNIAQAIFGIATPAIAWIGLQKWRAELKGKTEHEVAKNILVGAYRIRDEIEFAQNDRPPNTTQNDSSPMGAVYIGTTGYVNASPETLLVAWSRTRFAKVQSALSDWYPSVVEAEAIFGKEAKYAIDNLQDCYKKLDVANRCCFTGLDQDDNVADKKTTENSQGIVSGKNDEFEEKLKSSIRAIETFFSNYIRA